MKTYVFIPFFLFVALPGLFGGVKPGDKALPFTLVNVDNRRVSLSDYNDQKGVIIVFTSIPCPFSKAYEERIIQLHNTYASLGYPVATINSNDPTISPDDSFSQMQIHAREKAYPFPYLKDDNASVCNAYGATRTPQVYLLEKTGEGFRVAYIGAIDDNSLDARAVSNRYLEKAIRALSEGRTPEPAVTQAIGCTLKTTPHQAKSL